MKSATGSFPRWGWGELQKPSDQRQLSVGKVRWLAMLPVVFIPRGSPAAKGGFKDESPPVICPWVVTVTVIFPRP